MEDHQSNTALVCQLKKGDMAAFDAIYCKYCFKLYEFALMYLKQVEDAEEIVQEVFIKIWRARGKINIEKSFESFLFTVAYNETMSLLRKRVLENKSRMYLKSLQQAESANVVIDEIQYKELNDKVLSLLKKLTPRQREIYLLSREKGLTQKEIALRLNISESTVNNQMVRILKFFKSQIRSYLAVDQ